MFQTRKSLRRDSKEITKPAIFAQPITLLELARSKTGRTILRNAYKGTDENEYGFGWHWGGLILLRTQRIGASFRSDPTCCPYKRVVTCASP